MPLFGLINAWISPPGVCGAGLRGSVGSGVELKSGGGGDGPLPHVTPNSLTFFPLTWGFWVAVGDLGGGMNAEVKNEESDE